MASTRSQQGQLITQASSNGFLSQVIGSCMAMSIAVLTEAAATTDHANRLALARAFINAPSSMATWMLPGYLQSTNIVAACGTPSSVADTDVDNQTLAIWNFYADAYVSQLNSGAVPKFGS